MLRFESSTYARYYLYRALCRCAIVRGCKTARLTLMEIAHMNESLVQRRLLSSRTLTAEYNGVRILEKGLNKQFSFFVPFEEIPSTPFSLRIYDKSAIILTVVCSVIALFSA